jgi:hypothetical protein
MSPNPANSSRRGWRDGANKPAASNKDQGKRAWQKIEQPKTSKVSSGTSRGIKLGIAGGALAVLIGLLVWIVFWLRTPKPACLVLIGAGYETNLALPHNAAGWKGLEALNELAPRASGISSWMEWWSPQNFRLQFGPQTVEAGTSWDDNIWPKALSGFEEKSILIFLALHGAADDRGAYLWADDPHGQKRMYVRDILAKLKSPNLEGKRVVLVLDATQVVSHWPSGVLHNDFARQLNEMEKEIKQVPNLIVLSASDADQRSWVSEEWQKTIYAHYVIEGLKGAADDFGDKNRRVTAWELHQFVKDRVEAWADTNRDAVQTPVMIGDEAIAKNTELALVSEDYAPPQFTDALGLDAKALAETLTEAQSAWNEWESLNRMSPHPMVYSPHLWRQYQSTVIRYEQVLRLGVDARKKENLKGSLTKLADRIRQSGTLLPTAASLGNALPMPAVFGVAPPWTEQELQTYFQEIQQAEDLPKRDAAWTKLIDWYNTLGPGIDRQRKQLLQLQLSKLALQPLAKKEKVSAGDLEKASELLKWIKSRQTNIRSAETHFLNMLFYKEIAPPEMAPATHLHLALKVRLLAEETALVLPAGKKSAHPYSEVVWKWNKIKTTIEKADDKRRLGEDLLFGYTKDKQDLWDSAQEHLAGAAKLYQEALDDAKIVRDALDIRDRAQAALPYLAAWVAGQWLHGANDGRKQAVKDWLQRVEDMGKSVDALSVHIQDQEFEWGGGSLKNSADKLNIALDDMTKIFVKECNELRNVQQQGHWHNIQSVLEVPLLENLDIRKDLLEKSRDISGKLHIETTKKTKSQTADPNQLAELNREQARHEGLMALAVAGKPWLSAGSQDVDELRNRITSASRESWRPILISVGADLAEHWQKRLTTIQHGADSNLKEIDLNKAAKNLQQAEHFCRWVEAGAVPHISGDPFDPVQGARRLRVHDLLHWQAERTWKDHWHTDTFGKPYYKEAADNYLQDAMTLAKAREETPELNNKRMKTAEELSKRIIVSGIEAVVDGEPVQYMIGEKNWDVQWKFQVGDDVPPGIPMVWLNLDGPFEEGDTPKYVDRKPLSTLSLQGSWPPRAKSYLLVSNAFDEEKLPLVPEELPGTALLQGVYRGQKIESKVDLKVHTGPEILASRFTPPPQAKFAVYMDPDVPFGSLAIVIDASGSMNELVGGVPKITHVREAFRKVIETIPTGTYVSVSAFSGDGRKMDFIPLWEPQRWTQDEEARAKLMYRIGPNFLKIAGASPIAEAMVEAKTKGFPAAFQNKGPKVMLVLSDGQDNQLDGTLYPTGTPPDRIKSKLQDPFSKSDIALHVVCFAPSGNEKTKAEQQFDFIKDFSYPGIPGKFQVYDRDPADLWKTLEEILRPRVKLYDANFRLVPGLEEGRVARPFGSKIEWEPPILLNPPTGQTFRAVIQNVPEQSVYMRPGDLLLLKVIKDATKGLALERANFATLMEKTKIEKTAQISPDQKWMTAVLQNHYEHLKAELTQLVTVENVSAARADQLQHHYPGFVWIEVTDENKKTPGGSRWYQDYEYPVPAFRFPAGKLNPNIYPKTTLWFLDPDRIATFAESVSRENLKEGKTIPVVDTSITIERVELQQRFVSVGPGLRKKVDCLLVQMTYQPGQPVWLQPVGDIAGEEHRFYPKANRYTALFWGGTPDRFRIISIGKVKEEVTPMRWTLLEPRPTDHGPSRAALGLAK